MRQLIEEILQFKHKMYLLFLNKTNYIVDNSVTVFDRILALIEIIIVLISSLRQQL